MTLLPGRLTLEFSRAADRPRLAHLFSPAVKSGIDPEGFVVRREDAVIQSTLSRGGMTFLSDEHGTIQTMTATYHLREPGTPSSTRHPYTELGTTLAALPGFNSARLVIAAMTLKDWWLAPPKNRFIAEISVRNGGSLYLFGKALQWKHWTDPAKTTALQDLCNQSIAPDQRGNQVDFYVTTPSVLRDQAKILTEFMDRGGLVNKKTNGFIPVDFSALDTVGLTRARLDALASGETRRTALRVVSP